MTIPNGLAFSPAGDTCFLVDTGAKCVWRLDIDPGSGAVLKQSPFADLSDLPGVADGMAMDDQGRLWIALYKGGGLAALDPNGNVDRRVELPVTHPSSVIFGGPDLGTLFVTTGCGRLSAEERARQPLAGSVLAVHTGSRGIPPTAFGD
jgi:sugar lactone lactonase YvrE